MKPTPISIYKHLSCAAFKIKLTTGSSNAGTREKLHDRSRIRLRQKAGMCASALTGEMQRVSHETGTKFESIIHMELHASERQQMFFCLCPLQITQDDHRQRNRTRFKCNTANRDPRNGICLTMILLSIVYQSRTLQCSCVGRYLNQSTFMFIKKLY
jgi:hypothetical protein